MTDSKAYTQMVLSGRKLLEELLKDPNITRKQIALQLNRDPETISEEIKKNRYLSVLSGKRNYCGLQLHCTIRHLCNDCRNGKCHACRYHNCNQICPDFISGPVCDRVKKFPFVCSGCKTLSSCKLPKYFYLAETAQGRRDNNVRNHKYGIRKNAEEMKKIVPAFEDGVARKISPDVIIHDQNLPISTATAYRYIERREMGTVTAVDLKRKVRYKPRFHSKPVSPPADYDHLNGRRYEDFTSAILDLDPAVNIWEMDTVLGVQGPDQKCILSLLYRKTNLQLFFLLNSHTQEEVKRVFDGIKDFLGDELFRRTFTIILTDNGSEFRDPLDLETSPVTGEKLISIYFCLPRHSEQKGK